MTEPEVSHNAVIMSPPCGGKDAGFKRFGEKIICFRKSYFRG